MTATMLQFSGGRGATFRFIAAAFEVGFKSPSQFSREYFRKFGIPPSRDAAQAGV